MDTGHTIGHYRIIRPLGKGGMGEVYLAEDTRLDRQVAIKVLPERLRQNAERLARFRREAKAAASLKHPNIATIHALEEFDDNLLITMEYVEGASLKDHIPTDGMALDTFFSTFIPLADALAHAHSQGRIHRDLKPGNIMIAQDGTPKILDFGLARIIDPDPVQAAHERSETTPEIDSEAPTRTMTPAAHQAAHGVPSLTRGGSLMGTPQYMSPEQAKREETDGRSVAYQSNASGRFEVYVTEFPGGVSQWPVSVDGGTQPRRSRSGDELFFVDLSNRLMAARVRTGASFELIGAPRVLFDGARVTPPLQLGAGYDVTRDGRRFVAVQPVGTAEQARPVITLVQDWAAHLMTRQK